MGTRSDVNHFPNHRLDTHAVAPQTKSIKIIKDRDDRPKGFGYIEFATLDGLKDALARSGQSFASRVVRVSVAEPRESVLDCLIWLGTESTLQYSQGAHRRTWRLRRRFQVRCPVEARRTTPRLEGFARFLSTTIRRRETTTPFGRFRQQQRLAVY